MDDRPPQPIEPGSTGAFRTSSASRSPSGTPVAVPLYLRVVTLPFSPALWRAAARSGALWVVVPLLVLSLLANLALGTVRGIQFRGWLLDQAGRYDARFDPVVVEDGQVRVEGDRLPISTEGGTTFLVDPEEVFALDDITTPEYLVIRRDVVIRKQAFREQRFPVRDLTEAFGVRHLVVDGSSIRRFGERWGSWIGLGIAGLLVLFGTLRDAAFGSLYALAAAALLLLLRRSVFSGAFGAAFRLALAIYSIPMLGALVLHLGSVSPPCCLTTLFWPVLMTVAGMLAVGGRARL